MELEQIQKTAERRDACSDDWVTHRARGRMTVEGLFRLRCASRDHSGAPLAQARQQDLVQCVLRRTSALAAK